MGGWGGGGGGGGGHSSALCSNDESSHILGGGKNCYATELFRYGYQSRKLQCYFILMAKVKSYLSLLHA